MKRLRTPSLLALLLVTAALAVLFADSLRKADHTVWSADYSLAQHRGATEGARIGGSAAWGQYHYLGAGSSGTLIYPHWPILALLPVATSMWVSIALHMLWAGIGAWYCSRQMGVGPWGAALAGVAFGLTTHIVSLLYPGHVQKIQCIPWIPWTLACFWKACSQLKLRDFILTAMCLAVAFQSGEPQLPYYLGLCMAAIAILATLDTWFGREPDRYALIFKRAGLSVLCILLTLLLGAQSISRFAGLLHRVRAPDVEQAHKEESSSSGGKNEDDSHEEAYAFATSWSFPPEDMLTFFMSMQLFGGKSPGYWGRMGSENMVLKQTDDYVGVLVFFLALAGLVAVRRHKGARFMALLLFASLIIGLGKYTPVYRIIYELPTMKSQRIPARWLAFTVLSFSVLAGFGLDHLIRSIREDTKSIRLRWLALPGVMLVVALALVAVQSILGVGADDFALRAFGQQGSIATSPSIQLAQARAGAFVDSLRTTRNLLLVGAALVGGALLLSGRMKSEKSRLGTAIAVGVFCLLHATVDLSRNAKHFVEFYNWKQFHRGDTLVDYLKRTPEMSRIQPVGMRHPVINRLVGPLTGWHRLRFAEPTSLNVIPKEYAAIYAHTSDSQYNYRFNPRYYDIFNVQHVLTAFEIPADLLQYSRLQLVQKIPYGGSIPPVFLYRYKGYAQSPAFVSQTVNVEDQDEAIDMVCKPTFDLNTTIVGVDLPATTDRSTGRADLVEFGRRNIDIRSESDGPGWITCKVKYTPDWKAMVDNKPVEVHRVNYVHMGVHVPAGKHDVRLVFAPSRMSVNITWASWAVAGLFLAWSTYRARRSRSHARHAPELPSAIPQ